MGRTVASYRQALENEIKKWEGFRKALRAEDREAFDQMMSECRLHASAGTMATRPVLSEAMFMSILLEQQKVLQEIKRKLGAIEKRLNQAQEV